MRFLTWMVTVGLSSLIAAGATSCGVTCTEVGCSTVLSVGIVDSAGAPVLNPRGKIAVSGREIVFDCAELAGAGWQCFDNVVSVNSDEAEVKATRSVAVEVSNAAGTQTFAGEVTLSDEVSTHQPNGAWCEPTCYGRSGEAKLQ